MPNILRNAIIRLLDTANVPYDRYSHEPISSCESARIIREPLGIAAV
ncbi:MAG TPA: hypothetical protein PK765_03575 [bacterium]|nr:hypothetical protein [bacterium]